MSFGKKLKEVRLREGMSVRGLARLTNVSHAYISQLENSDNKQPTKNKLLEIAYALDPDGSKKIFKELIDTTSLPYSDADKEYKDYIETKNFDIDLDKISNKLLFNKNENTMKELEYPFVDIEWLLTQDIFHVYLGEIPNTYVTNKKGKSVKEIFVMNEDEKKDLKKVITSQKEKYVKERMKPYDEIDRKDMERMAKKYQFIEDLFNNKFKTEVEIASCLYSIDDNYKNVVTKDYINSIIHHLAKNDVKEIIRILNIDENEIHFIVED